MMNWYFLVSVSSNMVSYILMSAGDGFVLRALFNVHDEDNPPLDYWKGCSADELKEYTSGEYDIYVYEPDLELEDEGFNPDPENEIDWQIPLVQSWAKGELLFRHHAEKLSTPAGNGIRFQPSDFGNGNIKPNTKTDRAPSRAANMIERRCLWCGGIVEARYNFHIDWPVDFSEIPDGVASPILWSDGNWGDLAGYEPPLQLPNQYGDSVISCPVCNAAFLASDLEMSVENSPYKDELSSTIFGERTILPGSCEKGSNHHMDLGEWITHADVETTARFLELAQSSSLISWEEWTAAQQLLAGVANQSRKALINGKVPRIDNEEHYRCLLRKFVPRISTIKIGTLGSLGPFSRHREVTLDENFFSQVMIHDERIPVANMIRVCGEGGTEISLSWATPSGIGSLQDLDGWSEYDSWIARYGTMVREAAADGVTEWVFAVDLNGKRVRFN